MLRGVLLGGGAVIVVTALAATAIAAEPPLSREDRQGGVTVTATLLSPLTADEPLRVKVAREPISGAEPVLSRVGAPLGHAAGRWRGVSVAIHVVSNGLMLVGLLMMGAGWRRIHRAQGALVTDGPYAWVRHRSTRGSSS
jgi:hypothetical protein